jgi:hypothetical protein
VSFAYGNKKGCNEGYFRCSAAKKNKCCAALIEYITITTVKIHSPLKWQLASFSLLSFVGPFSVARVRSQKEAQLTGSRFCCLYASPPESLGGIS